MRIFHLFVLVPFVSILLSCEGPVGPSGINSLIETLEEPSGSNCEFGGLMVISGLDTNENGVLDEDEISKTDFVCSIAGNSSLISSSIIEDGEICPAGGVKIDIGIDVNRNDMLDDNEISSTEFICNGDFDKLIRVQIGQQNFGTASTSWRVSEFETWQLYNFNKNDYTGVDSITFVPSLYTSNENVKCIVELYNATDELAIEGSTIESNINEYRFFESGNIYDNLPDEDKLIGIRIRSEVEGTDVTTGLHSFIHIYRH